MQIQQAEGHCHSPGPLQEESKVYVLVRRDLPWPVRCVQATHAVMQMMRWGEILANHHIPVWGSHGPAVVLLGVADEAELLRWTNYLPDGATGFREPDLDELTAIAYYGQANDKLKDLRLL